MAMSIDMEKMDSKLVDVQREISGIRETLVGMQKDIEHISMKFDSYFIANKEEITDIKKRVYQLELHQRKLEGKVIWISSAAATIGAVISLLARFINF
jgi:hypothetical protein